MRQETQLLQPAEQFRGDIAAISADAAARQSTSGRPVWQSNAGVRRKSTTVSSVVNDSPPLGDHLPLAVFYNLMADDEDVATATLERIEEK